MEYSRALCGLFFVLLAGILAPVKGQCEGSTQKITVGNDKIQSPNFVGGEYGKPANCSWEFIPSNDDKEYAVVLTVTQLKLYVVKAEKKHCLGSYILTINNDQTECDRYVHDSTDNGSIPANYFCNTYYSSPACRKVSQAQDCETEQQTNSPVPVTYTSDGRRTNLTITPGSMYFKISYEFIECPKEPTKTTSPSTTTERTREPTTTITDSAPVEVTSTPGAIQPTTATVTTKTTTGTILQTTAEPDEETTLIATQSSMNPAEVTKKPDFTTPADNEGIFGSQSGTIIVAAAAGGGGVFLIVTIVLIVVVCKRKRKINITEAKHNVEVPLEEVNHPDEGTTENGPRASQSEDSTSPAVDLYATVSEPGKAPQQAIATGSTDGQSETRMGNAGSESTQPIAELYATVSKPPRLTEAKSPQPQDDHVAAPNQPEACLYATVSKPPRVTEQPQSSQPQDDHVAAPDQPEACLYAAVSIRKKGGKETVHYKKDVVDNVLYGTSDDYK